MYERLFGFNTTQKKSLMDFLRSKDAPFPLPTVQSIAAEEGAVENVVPSSAHTTVVLEEGDDLNILTLVFPPDNVSRVGQIIRIASMLTVSELNLTGTTIMNTVTSLLPNDCVGFQKVTDNAWIKII